MKKTLFIFLMLTGLWMLQACKKDETTANTSDFGIDDVEYAVKTDKLTDDILGIVDITAFDDNIKMNISPYQLPPCLKKEITVLSPTHYKIQLFFDNAGCECPNGNTYKGSIILERIFDVKDKKFNGNISFDSLYVNGVQIEGEVEFERKTVNLQGFPQSEYEFDITYYFTNGDIAKHYGNKSRIWFEGFNNAEFNDDIFEIEGEARIRKRNGVEISTHINLPLIKASGCSFYSSGMMEIEKENNKYILDFGNGTCDNSAVITYPDGNKQTIILNP